MQTLVTLLRPRGLFLSLLSILAAAFLAGCNDDSGGSSAGSGHDFGANDPNLYVAIGDSVTEGTETSGPSYPEILSGMIGKTVINEGMGGELSSGGAARIGGILEQHKPGYMLIMYGINDVVHVGSDSWTISNLSAIIGACKANGTVPVLATIPPLYKGGDYFDPRHTELNEDIRNLARSEDVALADVEAEFDNDPSLFIADGRHPNDDGTRIIAATFADVL